MQGPGLSAQYIGKWVKGDNFGGARSPLPLLLCEVLLAIYGPIVLVQNGSVFSLSMGFSENEMILELFWDPEDRVMSPIS